MDPDSTSYDEQYFDAERGAFTHEPMPSAVPEFLPELETDNLPSALFGYERYTIVKLLDKVRERIRTLTQERVERDHRIRELELEVLRSREGQRMIGETLIAAREEAQTIREEARRSAQKLLRSARKQANKILEETDQMARAKARELVDTAERERKLLVDEAGRVRAFIEETHEQLSDFLLAAVKWYEQAKPSPGDEPEAEAEAKPTQAQPHEAQRPTVAPNEPSNDRSSISSL